eukprot:7857066-Pyramimonas_sp.AAC.1
MGMPKLLYPIMFALTHMPEFPSQSIDCIEYFSGVGHIYSKFVSVGLPAVGYDIEYDPANNDLCSPQGFIFALVCMMRLSGDGLA